MTLWQEVNLDVALGLSLILFGLCGILFEVWCCHLDRRNAKQKAMENRSLGGKNDGSAYGEERRQ